MNNLISGISQFDIVHATYNPVRTDDLKPGVTELIGTNADWEVLWIIEEGPYAGQWAMVNNLLSVDLGTSTNHNCTKFHMTSTHWVPACDLDMHAIIRKFE